MAVEKIELQNFRKKIIADIGLLMFILLEYLVNYFDIIEYKNERAKLHLYIEEKITFHKNLVKIN